MSYHSGVFLPKDQRCKYEIQTPMHTRNSLVSRPTAKYTYQRIYNRHKEHLLCMTLTNCLHTSVRYVKHLILHHKMILPLHMTLVTATGRRVYVHSVLRTTNICRLVVRHLTQMSVWPPTDGALSTNTNTNPNYELKLTPLTNRNPIP